MRSRQQQFGTPRLPPTADGSGEAPGWMWLVLLAWIVLTAGLLWTLNPVELWLAICGAGQDVPS